MNFVFIYKVIVGNDSISFQAKKDTISEKQTKHLELRHLTSDIGIWLFLLTSQHCSPITLQVIPKQFSKTSFNELKKRKTHQKKTNHTMIQIYLLHVVNELYQRTNHSKEPKFDSWVEQFLVIPTSQPNSRVPENRRVNTKKEITNRKNKC